MPIDPDTTVRPRTVDASQTRESFLRYLDILRFRSAG